MSSNVGQNLQRPQDLKKVRSEEGTKMEELKFQSWEEFTKHEYRRCGTFQLSVEDLANDLYFDDDKDLEESEVEELNFDY